MLLTLQHRLQPGDTAPAFTLQDQEGRPVSLRDSAGKHTIVYFYPAASTPGCTTQACDFRDSLASLTAAGYVVLGISPDPIGKIIRFAEQEGLTSDGFRVIFNTGPYGGQEVAHVHAHVVGGEPLGPMLSQ